MRHGVTSAAFPQLTPSRLIDEAAAAGYSGIEWRVADVTGLVPELPAHYRTNNLATIAPTRTAMREVRARCADAGLAIVGLSPYITVGDIDAACAALDLAVTAGTDRVRIWAPPTGEAPYQESYDRFVRFLEQLVPQARRLGVRLVVEVHHGTICPSVSLTMRVVAPFPPEQVGVIYDVGNLAVEGYEDPRIALVLLGEHLAHVQLKNARLGPAADEAFTWTWCPMDAGVLPLPAIVSCLDQTGFDGWLCCEDFSTTHADTDKLRLDKHLLATYTKAST